MGRSARARRRVGAGVPVRLVRNEAFEEGTMPYVVDLAAISSAFRKPIVGGACRDAIEATGQGGTAGATLHELPLAVVPLVERDAPSQANLGVFVARVAFPVSCWVGEVYNVSLHSGGPYLVGLAVIGKMGSDPYQPRSRGLQPGPSGGRWGEPLKDAATIMFRLLCLEMLSLEGVKSTPLRCTSCGRK